MGLDGLTPLKTSLFFELGIASSKHFVKFRKKALLELMFVESAGTPKNVCGLQLVMDLDEDKMI